MKARIFLIVSLLAFSIPLSAQITDTSQIARAMKGKEFILELNTVYTQQGSFTPPNVRYLLVANDSAYADLVYWGRIYVPALTMTTPQIEFSEPLQDYSFRLEKRNYFASFTVQSIGEYFSVWITCDPQGIVTVTVNGSRREPIRYSGQLLPWMGEMPDIHR